MMAEYCLLAITVSGSRKQDDDVIVIKQGFGAMRVTVIYPSEESLWKC